MAIDGVCDSRRVADGYEQAVDSMLDEFPTNPGVRGNQGLSVRPSFDVDQAERFRAGWLHEHGSGDHQVAFLPVIDRRQSQKTPKISRLRLKVILEGLETGTSHYQSSLRTVRPQNLHCFYDRNTPLLEKCRTGRISHAEFATARLGSPADRVFHVDARARGHHPIRRYPQFDTALALQVGKRQHGIAVVQQVHLEGLR
jgi:hypothetical protein